MTIAYVAGGTHVSASGPTALNPSTPAGIGADDLSLLVVQLKGDTAGVAPTIGTPTNWTLIGTVTNNGTLADANDTGSNTVAVFYRIGAPASTAVGTLTTTGANTGGAVVHTWSKTGGTWDVTKTTTGSDTTLGANISVTGAEGLDLAPGDVVVVALGASGDVGSVTGESITVSGITFGFVEQRSNNAVTFGTDSRTLVTGASVSSGTSDSAPTLSYTNASSTTAHARFVRLREVVDLGQTATPTSITTGQALGAVAAALVLTVAPASIPSVGALGAPTAATTVTASPGGVGSAAAVGTPTAASSLVAAPGGIASAAALGSPTAVIDGGPITATPDGIPTAAALGTPTASAALAASPGSVGTAAATGTPAAHTALTAAPGGVPSGAQTGEPSASSTLIAGASSIPSAAGAGEPAAAYLLVVGPDGIPTAVALGAPTAVGGQPLEPPRPDPTITAVLANVTFTPVAAAALTMTGTATPLTLTPVED